MIELLTFELAAGSSEEAFLSADRDVQAWAYQQPGLLRRTTARSVAGPGWMVVDLWRSVADADACDAIWGQDPVTERFMAHVDTTTIRTVRYAELS